VLKATLRSLRAHKLRLALTGLAIILGVGFVAGSLVLTDTLNATFDNLFKGVDAGIDVRVRSRPTFSEQSDFGGAADERQPVPAPLLAEVQRVPGVRAVAGGAEGSAIVVAKDGKAIVPMGPPTLGVTFYAERALNQLNLSSGRGPANGSEFALDAATAKKHGFRVGDSVKVVLPNEPPRQFNLVGLFTVGKADTLLGATVSAFDTTTAQRIFQQGEVFNFINVKAADGVAQTELRRRVDQALGGRYEVITGQQLAEADASDVQQGIAFFGIFLQVFAAISLFVGTFLVANTFSIIVAQRTKELALLRALGARRRQVMASVLGEAMITAVVCSVLGGLFGVLMAVLIRLGLDAGGFGLPPGSLVIKPATFVVAFVVGVVVTLVSALVPARRATRVAPVEALRDSPAVGRSAGRVRAALGLATLALGAAAIAFGLIAKPGNAVVPVGLGAFLVLLGVAFLSPLIARPVARVLGAPVARFRKLPGRLAQENSVRNPRRTASTAAALMVGLALVTFVSVLAASVKRSSGEAIDRAFTADYIVASDQFQGFSPSLADELGRLPELDTVVGVTFGQWRLNGATKQLGGIDPRAFARLGGFTLKDGSLPSASQPGLLVDEKAAEKEKWSVGTVVPMQFAKTGVQRVPIAAIYKKNNLIGAFQVTPAVFDANFATRQDSLVLASKARNVTAEAANKAVQGVVAGFPNLEVKDQTELKASQSSQIDQLLGIVTGLLLLAIVIALLGIVNTLALSIYERTHELGLLRAVGMVRRQLRSMIRWEAVIIAVFGTLLGLVVGVSFGAALVSALHDEGITTLVVPGGSLVFYVVLAALAGVIAAIWPARRAAKLNVLAAIAHE